MWKGSNMTNTGYLKSDRKNDLLYTPYHIIDHITKYLPTDKIIWCPFDEKWSAFTVRLKERGYNVVSSHINDGQDFFTLGHHSVKPAIQFKRQDIREAVFFQ